MEAKESTALACAAIRWVRSLRCSCTMSFLFTRYRTNSVLVDMRPVFSLVYTSVRATKIKPMLEEWMRKARQPEAIEIVLAVDANDEASQIVAKELAAHPTWQFCWAVQDSAPFDCVRGWNLAATKVRGQVLVQVTDDIHPPDGWDAKLKALEPANWMDQDYAVHVEDGYVHNIMVLAIITKVRYDRFGYFFYPGYSSLFCDTELTEVAYREGRVIAAPHLLFEHKHPDCQKRERDAVDLVHASKERWVQGEMLFNYRAARGFPIDAGPNAVSKPVLGDSVPPAAPPGPEALKFACYIQATRDDLCLFEVCRRVFEEGVRYFCFSVPDEYWSGRVTPPDDVTAVRAVAEQVKALGAEVDCVIHQVASYRWPGDSRIKVETRVRNDALDFVRKRGYEHVLIVDGDELWRRGTLQCITDVIHKVRPAAVNCLMTPVVGCPGYPINGATDVAVVYVNSSVSFKECRTPIGDQYHLRMPLVIHFTGTRRTLEETIRKHKDSGHYDDPEYLFDEWIDKVLPHIKPGFKHRWPNGIEGVHMFKQYQIWPSVREWLAEEIKDIPPTVFPYLGLPEHVKDTSQS